MRKDVEKYMNVLDKFRCEHIPKRYNQVELLNYLCDDDINHYMIISNRNDGKSFNYVHALIHISYKLGLRFFLVCRHYTVRMGYQNLIIRILDKSKIYNSKDFHFARGDFYTTIYSKEKVIGLISDLNQATDLKYFSNYLVDFPIIVYDEFLALEGDYLPDEWEKLKTIYASVNRTTEDNVPYIRKPKVIYIGNAVNFSSPIISELKLFNILENHPMNTIKKYDDIMLQMVLNDNANKERNLSAFREYNDDMTNTEFKINKYGIITEREKSLKSYNKIIVKINNRYLCIYFTDDKKYIYVSLTTYEKKYDFHVNLDDNNGDSVYINDRYYKKKKMEKIYMNGEIMFDNSYTKKYFFDNGYNTLDVYKIIDIYIFKCENNSVFDKKNAKNEVNYERRTKQYIFRRFNRI